MKKKLTLSQQLATLSVTAIIFATALVAINGLFLFRQEAEESILGYTEFLTDVRSRQFSDEIQHITAKLEEIDIIQDSTLKDSRKLNLIQRLFKSSIQAAAIFDGQRRILQFGDIPIDRPEDVAQTSLSMNEHHLVLTMPIGDRIAVGLMPKTSFDAYIESTGPFRLAIVNRRGKTIVSNINSFWPADEIASIIKQPTFDRILKEVTDKNDTVRLIGIATIKGADLAIAVSVPKKVAFESQQRIVYRSILIGMMIVIIVLLSTSKLMNSTLKPLQRLMSASQSLGRGEFQSTRDLPIEGSAEVATLTRAFRRMGSEIEGLIVHAADRARMQSELKTAKIIQSTLFPPDHLRIGPLEIASYFQPATEVGGDWWTVIPISGYRCLIVLGDATGHGAGAALLTATVHSACTTFVHSRRGNNFTTAQLMDSLNHAVHEAAKGKILIHLIAMIVDCQRHVVQYTNASHLNPFIFRNKGETVTRGQFEPLIEANGARLGEKAESTYTVAEASLYNGDLLFLFTDGLVEACDPQGNMYRTGKFIRHLTKILNSRAPNVIIERIMADHGNFTDGVPADDDLTLIVGRYGGQS